MSTFVKVKCKLNPHPFFKVVVLYNLGPNKCTCLSTDIKPIAVPINFEAWETDTRKKYKWDGFSWIPQCFHNPYTYIIFNDGTRTYGQDSAGKIITYDADPSIVFNAIGSAMNSAGTGVAFVKNGVYTIPAGAKIIASYDNQVWTGESKEKTIIETESTINPIFARYFTPLQNFGMKNMTLQSSTIATLWYSSGTRSSKFENVNFRSLGSPALNNLLHSLTSQQASIINLV